MEFNYCVGSYWSGKSGSVGTYAFGKEVFFGTLKEAKKFLKYVKSQSPDKDWKIFQLVEVPK